MAGRAPLGDVMVAVSDGGVVRRVLGRLPPQETLALAARWAPAAAAQVQALAGKSKKVVTAGVAATILVRSHTHRRGGTGRGRGAGA
jgi:hypothetical protein